MRVIGTAGHVDHGKSTLVQALTGMHPDRLKEERDREMTIDLGFAWMTLPGGEEVGIVDVPGHRDFIENMLSGIGSIDAVMFVVAADEGVMPQTREHLAILDILQIESGVVVLTKIDLLDDPDWLELVTDDVRQTLAGTVLASAPILRVSSKTNQGIPELLQTLETCLSQRPLRPDLGRPRLPVDRVFMMAGFGTVLTGTLSDGCLRLGDEVQILGGGAEVRGRVRGLQTHKRKEEVAVPGSRTAVNVSGVNVEQVQRGGVLAHPGDYTTTRRMDVRFRLLPDVQQPLQHNTPVKFFLGAAEVAGRVRLLGVDELLPGQAGWLQLELNDPVVSVRGDRYILRRPSPGETLGGGAIVDPHPGKRHKRFSNEILERLEMLEQGTPEDVLMQALLALGAAPWQEIAARSNLILEVAVRAGKELIAQGQMLLLEADSAQAVLLPSTLATSKPYWSRIELRAIQEIEAYHQSYPLRQGLPKEELKSRLKMPPRFYNALLRRLIAGQDLVENGPLVYRAGHNIQFTPQQKQQAEQLLKRFAASPASPPSVKESCADVGEEIYNALVELGELVPLSSEVVFRRSDYQAMVESVRELLKEHGTITAAQVRDHFGTSRRYVLALLEHLDALGMTLRDGDVRRLRR